MATSDIGKAAFLNVKNKDTGEIEKKTLIPPAPSDGDLGGISEEELAQITTNKEKISLLNEELTDGRTDVDGEVHKNIGDAMRGQARKLRENLVVRQKDQPTDPNNNVWISDEDDEVEVPDMGEFNSLEEDIDTFKNDNGYILKPLYSIHKDSIKQGTFVSLGNAIIGHRYALVFTPIFGMPVSLFILDENSKAQDTKNGQVYLTTITASATGVITLASTSNIDMPIDFYVYDTTGDDSIQDFVVNSLLLSTELKYNYKGRQKIFIKSAVDEAINVIKLTGACNVGNIDVYFEDANYDFSLWYNYVYYMNGNNAFRCEIPIGNGCIYYFNGATINGIVKDNLLASPNIKTNCALFGSRTNEGDYKLINGVINATGTIYSVHDEMSGKSKYNHGYENMIINYISGTQKEAIRKCIGGGAGRNGTIVLKNCILKSDYSHELTFHGYGNVLGDVDGKITINISDCYFEHGIAIDTLPEKEIGTIITVCNSFRSDYADYANNNWNKYSWNNESRVK
jgi:hypothetical protein